MEVFPFFIFGWTIFPWTFLPWTVWTLFPWTFFPIFVQMPSIIDITTENLNSTDIQRDRFMKVSFVLQLLFAISSHKEKKTRIKQIDHSI